jgi:hypothetical protein
MPEARKPNPQSNSYISGVRLANIRLLITAFRSQADFCRAVSKREPQISQYFTDPSSPSHRQVGGIVARDIEQALDIPSNCLDHEDGVAEFIPALSRKWKGEASVQSLGGENLDAKSAKQGDLSSLQIATLDAVKNAMRAGRLSKADCLAMLNRWAIEEADESLSYPDRPRNGA